VKLPLTSLNTGIIVEDVPTANFNFITNEMNVQFINTSQNGNTYLWTFSDGQQSTIANPTIFFTENGDYTATLAVTNNCGTTEINQSFTIDVNALNEIDGIEEWSVFPNPNAGDFTLNLNGNAALDLNLTVFDVFGKAIYFDKIRKQSGVFSKKITLHDVSSGLYFLKIENDEGVIFEKMILE